MDRRTWKIGYERCGSFRRSLGLSRGFGPPADLALLVGLKPKIGIPRGSAHNLVCNLDLFL